MGRWEEEWMDRAMRSRWGTSYGRPPADMRCAMCALDPHSLPDEAREAFTVMFGYAICTDHFDQIFPGEDEAVEMRMRNMIESQIRKDIRQMFDRTMVEHEHEQRRAQRRRDEAVFLRDGPKPAWMQDILDHANRYVPHPDEAGGIKIPTDPSDMSTEAREEAEAFLKAQEENRRKREGS